eukprot:TRINITY_DN42625_c0_g1_i1.p1 TRINITY_DN42625_c0_g1~~TRINITY_DN42625_c0_g1_i1.p1  ORF type:complete len:116 (-),score=14.14 TRINITY_DN42625_c0_g1_i1:133-480(-)
MPYETGRFRQFLSLTRSREKTCEQAQTKQATLSAGRRLWRSFKGLATTRQCTHDPGNAGSSSSLLTSVAPCDSSQASQEVGNDVATANDVDFNSTSGSSTLKNQKEQSRPRVAWS